MATNRPDTLDPALVRPGRLDRKVEFALPDLEGRTHILKIHAKQMSVEKDIRYDLLARLCPNSTGRFAIGDLFLTLPKQILLLFLNGKVRFFKAVHNMCVMHNIRVRIPDIHLIT